MPRRALLLTTVALTGVLVAGTTGAAFAADDDVDSGNFAWVSVDDEEPSIGDAQSRYPNALGTGVDLVMGWTGDAFDSVLSGVDIEGESVDWTAGSGGAGWVPGGLSSFVYSGTAAAFDPAFEISARLEIQGNYARWMFTQVAGPTGELELFGNLGSDGDETAIIVTPTTAVVTSDDNEADPVLGYWVSGDAAALDITSGDDDIRASATTTAPITFVIALQDYAPCAEAIAIDEMVARVPSLNATFGTTIPGALECATVATPASLATNSSEPQTLAVTLDPTVNAWLADPWQISSRGPYLSDPSVVGSAFTGVPAGVTLVFDPATSAIQLTGQPTTPGSYDVQLLLYLTDAEQYSFDDAGNGHPILATFSLEVTGAVLAATGSDDELSLALTGGMLLAAGAALVLLSRRSVRVRGAHAA